ncbi:hypothetical protein NHH03_06560 [Stieleria sp. TO1_6]|nr:hypothetical protein [Stieleria tagensis]
MTLSRALEESVGACWNLQRLVRTEGWLRGDQVFTATDPSHRRISRAIIVTPDRANRIVGITDFTGEPARGFSRHRLTLMSLKYFAGNDAQRREKRNWATGRFAPIQHSGNKSEI